MFKSCFPLRNSSQLSNFGLVAHFPLDTAGPITRNSVNGEILTLNSGTASIMPGLGGRGAVVLPNGTYFSGGGRYIYNLPIFTLCGFIRPLSLPCALFGLNDGGAYDHELYVKSTGALEAYVYSGGIKILTSAAGIVSSGVFSFIALTADGATMKIYYNGFLVASLAIGQAYSSYGSPNAQIGLNTSNSIFGNAAIQDVRLYSRALSQQELLDAWTNKNSLYYRKRMVFHKPPYVYSGPVGQLWPV